MYQWLQSLPKLNNFLFFPDQHLAHILLSTQVRLFVLPLAFMHEGTYNPVQAEGKYKPAEGYLVPLVFYSVAIVSSNKNESKSGDITWHSNFGDVLLIVVNREVNNIKREGKRSCLGIFSALDVR